MRRNSFLSPVTDLFIALSLVFFVLFIAKSETTTSDRAQDDPIRALHYQRLRHGKDAAFRFGGTELTLETAFHARQAIYNRIHKLHEHWRGEKELLSTRLHFRIVTNSDPLLGNSPYVNWQRSSERALSVLQAGFCSETAFRRDISRILARALEERGAATGDAAFAERTRELTALLDDSRAMHWLYAYECSDASFSPRLTAYICLWDGSRDRRRVALFRREKFERTELLPLTEKALPGMLARFARYREDLPFGPVDYRRLYEALDEAWSLEAARGAPLLLDEDGLFFETTLPPRGKGDSGFAALTPWDDALFPYLPFFLIANKGSFDSFSSREEDIQTLLDTLQGKLLTNLQAATDLPAWRVPRRINRLLGLDNQLRTLPEPAPGESLNAYFRRNEKALRFLLTCQISRGYDIFDIGEETIGNWRTSHIQYVLEQLRHMAGQNPAKGGAEIAGWALSEETRRRINVFADIQDKFDDNDAYLKRYAPYSGLLPKKSAPPAPLKGITRGEARRIGP